MDQFETPEWPDTWHIAGHLSIADNSAVDQFWVRDAAGWVERYTGHILVARQIDEDIRGFSTGELRAWPIASGEQPYVSYVDGAGATVVVPARVDATRRPARIVPLPGARWPTVARDTVVSVRVRAGYQSVLQMPPNFHRAMMVLIGAYDADREGGEIFQLAEKSARSLCSSYRLRRV